MLLYMAAAVYECCYIWLLLYMNAAIYDGRGAPRSVTQLCVCVCVRACVRACVCVCVCVHVRRRALMHIDYTMFHTHAQRNTHTRIHAQSSTYSLCSVMVVSCSLFCATKDSRTRGKSLLAPLSATPEENVGHVHTSTLQAHA